MHFSLLFLALIASVTCIIPESQEKEDLYDSSAPVEYQVGDNSSSHLNSLSVDISIDWGMLVAMHNATLHDSDSDSGSWSFPCSFQLLAIIGIAAMLAVLIAIEVFSLYMKRKAKAADVVHVKNTV